METFSSSLWKPPGNDGFPSMNKPSVSGGFLSQRARNGTSLSCRRVIMVEVSENRIVITSRDRNIQRDRTWRGIVAEENVRVGSKPGRHQNLFCLFFDEGRVLGRQ